MNNWFSVDKEGLSRIMSRKGGKSFAVFELLQNSWDENSSEISLKICRKNRSKDLYTISITDDNPEGFTDLTDSYTLFAESKKKADPEKRGRFNLGEKLVLACCEEVKIISTKGTVYFAKSGKRTTSSKFKTEKGTEFIATISLTQEEYNEICNSVLMLIPPKTIDTFFNGQKLKTKNPIKSFFATLPTEVADENGFLRRTTRKTKVEVYEVQDGAAYIYEMGIPLVETNDKYHVNICQRVPTNLERDNVSPSYLNKVRTLVLNETYDLIQNEDEANSTWVKDALENTDCEKEAVKAIVEKRFGSKAVVFDPSDPEANKLAVTQGYTVIPGGSFNSNAWQKIKESGVVKPAGQVTPSPKPFTPGGTPLKTIHPDSYTEEMKRMVEYIHFVAKKLIRNNIQIILTDDKGWKFDGCYGDHRLHVNISGGLKECAENLNDNIERLDDFLLHELAHEYEKDHLSNKYHEACTKLGARLKRIAIRHRSFFEQFEQEVKYADYI